MAFWIFKCNPEKYRLEDRLADPNPTLTWTVSRHRDEIELRRHSLPVGNRCSNRGIRAVMRVDQAPGLLAELESEQPYWVDRDTQEQWRVLGTLTHRFVDLSHTALRNVPGLEELSVFHGFQQMTNFPVTPEEGAILMRMIEGSQAVGRPSLTCPSPTAPRDDWERVLLGVATDCGVSLSDSAVSSEGIYE